MLSLIKGFNVIIKSFFNLLQIFRKPLIWFGSFVYRYFIIGIYRIYFYLRKILKIIFPSEKFKPVYILINKYSSHIFIIFLAIIISFTNLFVSQTGAESFGEKSILYTLATGSNTYEDKYIEESIDPALPKIKTSYLESQGAAVSGLQAITAETTEESKGQLPVTGTGAIVKPEISSIEVAQKYRDEPIEYIVQGGDTIGSIAEEYEISEETIMWQNNLSKYSIIRPGQKLLILPISGVTHTVAKGDTLSKIATRYKADEQKIIDYNKLVDASDISVGQLLIIPEGTPYRPPLAPTQLAPIKQIFEEPIVDPGRESGKMLWPNGCRRITQYFSWRHIGLDIACPRGTPIRAADDGVVTKMALQNTGYGHHAIIDHGNGKSTLYGHMDDVYVREGQKVQRGEIIGLEGSTGKSTGPHLHFEVRFWGVRYNPLNYIK
ncbi:peptidoglycan DD-metalloendopeptidase family protein [Candidatus Falkowbacteria bacterium]|nr:peptidoglycan DD-metalloendopeptidase family protein [Candidatus Falkowbacteria bacterium]